MIKKDGTVSNLQSLRNREWWQNPEYRECMVTLLRNKKHTKEAKDKISATLKSYTDRYWQTPEYRAKMGAIRKGCKLSEETKRKISIGNTGKHHIFTDEHKRHISEALKGRIVKGHAPSAKGIEKLNQFNHARKGTHMSTEMKQKLSNSLKGRILSEEHRRKIGLALKGRKLSPEALENMRIGRAKRVWHWNLESRLKASISHQGERSPLWKGGVSYEPYTIDFGRTVKRIIRERDKYICQLCYKDIRNLTCDHAIHHIDYDKKNCKHENLILLCHLCHIKTNMNSDWWTVHFQTIMVARGKHEDNRIPLAR
jgi:hypothetical protein